MQKVIGQITDHLVTLVTSDKEFYNPNELLKSGVPSFVVERIRLFLEDKVKEEIGTIKSLWFNTDTKIVLRSFSDYISSAISCSHIPNDQLYSIIHTVIKDIVYVFVEPRKNMAEYIFRDNDELTLPELEERCNRLTIYKHFGAAIPLYMKKRELDSLTKERCKILIHKLDAKLVASYTPKDWAQKLEQLFILFGGKVDPLLLATFFEDKGLYGLAGKFEHLKDSITKTDFISIIASNDSNTFTPEIKPKIEEKKKSKINSENETHEKTLIEGFFETNEVSSEGAETLVGKFVDGSLSDEEMSELLSDIASDGVIEVDHHEHVDSLNKLFSLNTEADEESQVSETSEEIAAKLKEHREDDTEDIAEFRENLVSILDQAKNSFENIDSKEHSNEIVVEDELMNVFEDENTVESKVQEETSRKEGASKGEIDEAEEKPVWAQFINQDQMDVLLGGERNSKTDKVPIENFVEEDIENEDGIEVDDIYSENPFIEDSSSSGFVYEEMVLESILEDRKSEFIEIIFKGSEKKFEKTVDKINDFKDWKDASKFIQKDVFLKNDVDMFAGATVDFTDRIHQYFNEKRNS